MSRGGRRCPGCSCITPPGGCCAIATGIRLNGCAGITIRDLTFTNLSNAVVSEDQESATIVLENLTVGTSTAAGDGMTGYGVFLLVEGTGTPAGRNKIDECDVYGAYDQHCFRAYASELDITNSTGAESRRASGLWLVEGRDVTVNGFSTQKYVRIGPNFACCGGGGPDDGTLPGSTTASERLRGADLRNVTATQYVEIELGTIGCYLVGIAASDVHVGEVPWPTAENIVPRPLDRIHWEQSTLPLGEPGVAAAGACLGTDISPCYGDVDDVGPVEVDVDDLIGVILAWGQCPPPWDDQPLGGSCVVGPPPVFACIEDLNGCDTPVNTCPADIFPIALGNGVVDVDDLVAVILNWGCTSGGGGTTEGIPDDFQDCMNMCNTCCPETYGACMQRCLAALCAQGQTQYCDD